MTARTWLGALLLVLLAVFSGAGSASAAGELELSSDGVTWGSELSGPLFDPGFRWVPSDSETASFYVRNVSGEDAVLNITMLTGPVESLIETGDLRISAKVGGGAYTGAESAGPQLLVEDVQVAPDAVRKVTVRVDFDAESSNASQELNLDFRFNVNLSQSSVVEPPTNPGNGGNGNGGNGDLPNTGNVVTPYMFLLAVLLVAAGTGFIGYGRRRTTHLEERSSHVQA